MAADHREHYAHLHHHDRNDFDHDDGAVITPKRSSSSSSSLLSLNKGAWTAEEDEKLTKYIEIHGPRRWKSIAIKSGLNRCGKSCRLRWLNYLRPDIKRGNISKAEDDLILRLHRLLGNRWSLIARRLPGRTDNEIKNYWNAHLRKKAKLMEKLPATSIVASPPAAVKNWCTTDQDDEEEDDEEEEGGDESEKVAVSSSSMESGSEKMMMMMMKMKGAEGGNGDDHEEELFDFSRQGTCGLEWVKCFLELEEEDDG